MEIVKQDGRLLQQVTTMTKEIVIAAVKNYGHALEYAPQFNDDKEVVLTAVKNAGSAIQFASPALQRDKEVVIASVRNNTYAIRVMSTYANDPDVILAAASENAFALLYASHTLRENRAFMMSLLKRNGNALEFISGKLYYEKEVLLTAVNTHGPAIQFIPYVFIDPQLLAYAKYSKVPKKLNMRQNEVALRYVNEKWNEWYGFYLLKRMYPGHTYGFLKEIYDYLNVDKIARFK